MNSGHKSNNKSWLSRIKTLHSRNNIVYTHDLNIRGIFLQEAPDLADHYIHRQVYNPFL